MSIKILMISLSYPIELIIIACRFSPVLSSLFLWFRATNWLTGWPVALIMIIGLTADCCSSILFYIRASLRLFHNSSSLSFPLPLLLHPNLSSYSSSFHFPILLTFYTKRHISIQFAYFVRFHSTLLLCIKHFISISRSTFRIFTRPFIVQFGWQSGYAHVHFMDSEKPNPWWKSGFLQLDSKIRYFISLVQLLGFHPWIHWKFAQVSLVPGKFYSPSGWKKSHEDNTTYF